MHIELWSGLYNICYGFDLGSGVVAFERDAELLVEQRSGWVSARLLQFTLALAVESVPL